MDIIVLLQQAVLNHASDIFVVAGLPVSIGQMEESAGRRKKS